MNERQWRTALVIAALVATGLWAYNSATNAPTLRYLLLAAGEVWLLAFGLLVGWRRPDSAQVRMLSAALLVYAIFDALVNFPTASALTGDVIGAIGAFGVAFGSTALVATFASSFARPLTPLRRAAEIATYIAVPAWCYWALGVFDVHLPLWPWLGVIIGGNHFALPRFCALVCGLLAIAATRGVERQRVAWPVLSFGVLYVASIAGYVATFTGLDATGYSFAVAISIFILPLGLLYSALSRRLYDIGFVLNRAGIFSGVSIVLVGIFVLVEWLLSGWLQGESHSTNLLVTGALALVLGLSIRFVHARVEHVVDNVFFRRRREDEEAIRTLARESPYITNRETLLGRVSAVLSKHADASFVRVMLDDGEGTYGSLDENDPALVALRAKHNVLDLHTVETGISGDLAYPMVVRGRLLGALVLGPKRSGESYAPDESGAIAQLARDAGTAVDALVHESSRRGAFEQVHLANDALMRKIDELPERIVAALLARSG